VLHGADAQFLKRCVRPLPTILFRDSPHLLSSNLPFDRESRELSVHSCASS
jgi:hypothetical protein